MKITELKCTACSGTLKITPENPHMAVCEYCHTRYVIEDDGIHKIHTSVDSVQEKKHSCFQGMILLLFVFFFFIGIGSFFRAITNNREKGVVSSNLEAGISAAETTKKEDEPFTGVFAMMAENVLGKPAKELTEGDLSRFQWLEMNYGMDTISVGYSFDNPYEDESAVLSWISFPRDDVQEELPQISRFKGVKKLNVAGYLDPEILDGLSLVGLGCYAESPADIAGYSGASGLKELDIKSGINKFDGLNQFSALESLTLNGNNLTDIKELVSLKSLKSLTLDNCDDVKDFSVLSVMPLLEKLSVDSDGLRDIDFLSSLTNLKSFSVSDGQMLQVNELVKMTGLEKLSIVDCDEIKDFSGIEELSQLKELSLEIPYDCPRPSLKNLTNLNKLYISGADNVDFLQNMKLLESLELDNCEINQKEVFSGLLRLKKLECSHASGDLSDWGFINQIPSLEYLDLSGVSTYGDISSLFGISTLQELYLNGMECEINFDKVGPNETLRKLEMDGIKLYKNVSITGGGGIYYVDYDDVALDANLNFLTKFPGLKTLSLADNTLTDISFASQLNQLEEFNINENYITDLKPLAGLSKLKNVFCTDNPIDNYRVLNENVMIIY